MDQGKCPSKLCMNYKVDGRKYFVLCFLVDNDTGLYPSYFQVIRKVFKHKSPRRVFQVLYREDYFYNIFLTSAYTFRLWWEKDVPNEGILPSIYRYRSFSYYRQTPYPVPQQRIFCSFVCLNIFSGFFQCIEDE